MPSLRLLAAVTATLAGLLLSASAARVLTLDTSATSVKAAERVAEAAAAAGLVPPGGRAGPADGTPPLGRGQGRGLKDAISSYINSIAAEACAAAGPEQCRTAQEFVAKMYEFCTEQYGYAR